MDRHERLRYRTRAAKEFDQSVYRWRGMIEAIFGAEESDEHNLRTRLRKEENRERWVPIIAIGMEPQGPQQAKMAKDAWDGGEVINRN